jgi:hypothetical protein
MSRPVTRGSTTPVTTKTPTTDAQTALDADARRQQLARQFLEAPDAPTGGNNARALKQIDAAEKKAETLKHKRLLEIKAEQEERDRLLAEAKKAGKPLGPIMASSVNTLSDASLIVGQNGDYAVKDGHIGRWVRLTDSQERESYARAREFRQRGWEPILDDKGEPITGPLGLAMQAPAEAVADYRALQEKDRIDMSTIKERFAESVEQMNREAGTRIAIPFEVEDDTRFGVERDGEKIA